MEKLTNEDKKFFLELHNKILENFENHCDLNHGRYVSKDFFENTLNIMKLLESDSFNEDIRDVVLDKMDDLANEFHGSQEELEKKLDFYYNEGALILKNIKKEINEKVRHDEDNFEFVLKLDIEIMKDINNDKLKELQEKISKDTKKEEKELGEINKTKEY